MEKELELGRYLESDMLELTDDEVEGGATPAITVAITLAVTGYISNQSCPTTACTRRC